MVRFVCGVKKGGKEYSLGNWNGTGGLEDMAVMSLGKVVPCNSEMREG